MIGYERHAYLDNEIDKINATYALINLLAKLGLKKAWRIYGRRTNS